MITDPVAFPALQSVNATSATGTLPTGGSSGDLIVCAIGGRGGSALTITTATSGWTKQGQGQQSTGSIIAVFTASWGAAAPAFTWGGSTLQGWIQMFVLRGAGTINAPAFGNGTVATHTAPTTTASTRGNWRLLIAATQGATAYTAPPAGFEVARNTFGGGSTTNTREMCLFAFSPDNSEYTTGTRTFTGAASSWVACSMTIEPAVATSTAYTRFAYAQTSATSATATLDGTHVSATLSGLCTVCASAIFSGGTQTVTGVTAAGTSMTAGPTQQSSGSYSAIHYLADTSAANGTNVAVVASRSGAADSITILAMEIIGLATSSPLDASGSGTGTGTAVSAATSAAPTAGVRRTIMTASNNLNGSVVTEGTNFELVFSYINGSTGQVPNATETREYTADGSTTETAAATLGTSGTWTAVVAVFKVAGATGVNANANLGSETETTLAASVQGGANTAAVLQALAASVLAATARGSAAASVNLLGVTGSAFAAGATGQASGPVNLGAVTETPLAASVQGGALAATALGSEVLTTYAATAAVVTQAGPVALLTGTETLFTASGIGGAAPAANQATQALSTLLAAVQAGASVPVNLDTETASLLAVASVLLGASPGVNFGYLQEPYVAVGETAYHDAIGGATVPVNLGAVLESLFTAAGQGGASVPANLGAEAASLFALSALAGAQVGTVRQTETETNYPADVNAPGGVSALVSLQAMTETPQIVAVQAGSLVQVSQNLATLQTLGITASGGAQGTLALQSLLASPLGLLASGGASGPAELGQISAQASTLASAVGGASVSVNLLGQVLYEAIHEGGWVFALGSAQALTGQAGLAVGIFPATVAGIIRAANFALQTGGVLYIPSGTGSALNLGADTGTQYPAGTSGVWPGPYQNRGEYGQ